MTRIYYEHEYKKWVDEALEVVMEVCFGDWNCKPNLPTESKVDDLCYDMDDNLEMCVIEFEDEEPEIIVPIIRTFIDGYCLGNGAKLEDFI